MQLVGAMRFTHTGNKLLDDLVEAFGVRGDRGTAAQVQGEFAERENVSPSVPARKSQQVLALGGRLALKRNKTIRHVHVRDEMQDEVLGSQGVSQEDVSEVREQLCPHRGHLAQGRR